jgi:hypothetical protein
MTDDVDRIHAGELRALGATIDERIPDCAWVNRAAMHWKVAYTKLEANGTLNASIDVTFDEPFKWVEATVTIGEAKEIK